MSEALVELWDVSRHFRKGAGIIRAVDRVCLQVSPGEFLAIQGPSGSGKSTLLHLIGALDWPTEGDVIFNGVNLSRLSDRSLSKLRSQQIGIVFQSFNLIPDMNVLENVALPLKYAGAKNDREKRALEVIEAVGLLDRANHRPNELSGGEEQRVAFARALVNQPDILLADEPTGNLDSQNRAMILDIFHSVHARGQTIIVVTHDPTVADAAQRKLWMLDGKI